MKNIKFSTILIVAAIAGVIWYLWNDNKKKNPETVTTTVEEIDEIIPEAPEPQDGPVVPTYQIYHIGTPMIMPVVNTPSAPMLVNLRRTNRFF